MSSNQSLPLSEPPRRVLAEIISKYGTDICSTPTQVEALLRDLCGEYRREINLLMSALKDKVSADLQSASVTPPELLIGRLTTRLRDNHSLTEEAARWSVESWALALGRVTRDQLTAPLPASPPVAPAAPVSLSNPTVPAPQYASPPQYSSASNPSGPSLPVYFTAPAQPPTVWPPPVQSVQTLAPNTSGTLGPPPPEIMAMRWNWAAFFWNWLWMCNNGLAGTNILLLISCFIPYVNIISVIYLGIKGSQLAWQHRRFDSVDHFKRVQGVWTKWAVWVIAIGLIFDLLGAMISGCGNNH